MRFLLVAAGSAAAIIGLGVLPSHAADVAPPAPLAEYDEPEPIFPFEPEPVVLEPVPPAPVVIEPAYVYGGYNYCWYEAGWRGPGWYVCNYGPWIRGAWWGGPAGWNGWAWRGGPPYYGRPYGYPRAGFGPPVRYPPRGVYGGWVLPEAAMAVVLLEPMAVLPRRLWRRASPSLWRRSSERLWRGPFRSLWWRFFQRRR